MDEKVAHFVQIFNPR